MQPPSLRSISQTIIIRTLVCTSTDCKGRQLLLESLKTTRGSEDILLLVTELFPRELNDELLYVLAPQHLRNLKLQDCTSLTCDGIVKTITKCSHLTYLDFSRCENLLRPAVYCCLKDNAPHITHLAFEDCELMTDDVVQIILMCCPGLEYLNISSCKNITDKAFVLSQSSSSSSSSSTTSKTSKSPHKLSQRALLGGKNLSSVDLSGCPSLTSTAIKNLATLCGPTLTSVNISWTGVGCTALLYLAGLSPQAAIQFVREVDSSCLGVLTSLTETEESDSQKGLLDQENQILTSPNSKESDSNFSDLGTDGHESKNSVQNSAEELGQTSTTMNKDGSNNVIEISINSDENGMTRTEGRKNSLHDAKNTGHMDNKSSLKNNSVVCGNSTSEDTGYFIDVGERDEHAKTDKIECTSGNATKTFEVKETLHENRSTEKVEVSKNETGIIVTEKEELMGINECSKFLDSTPQGYQCSYANNASEENESLRREMGKFEAVDLKEENWKNGNENILHNQPESKLRTVLASPECHAQRIPSQSVIFPTVGLPSACSNTADSQGPSSTSQKEDSLDKEWMLAWQQIGVYDDSCSDNDELFDNMWGDMHGPSHADSVSFAFGDAISCLTSALMNLESDDDDDCDEAIKAHSDDGDNGDGDDNGGGGDSEGDDACDGGGDDDGGGVVAGAVGGEDGKVINTHGSYDLGGGSSGTENQGESLDDANDLFADILNLQEWRSEDSGSLLHGFSDALVTLTNAMIDLIGSEDDEEDGVDGGNDTDVDIDGGGGGGDGDDGGGGGGGGDDDDDDGANDNDGDENDDVKTHTEIVKSRDSDSLSLEMKNCSDSNSTETETVRKNLNLSMNIHKDSQDPCRVDNINPVTLEEINLVMLPKDHIEMDSEAINLAGKKEENLKEEPEKVQELESHKNSLCENRSKGSQKESLKVPYFGKSSEQSEPTILTLTYKPRLRSLDITNIYFHSKALGVASLKLFSAVNRTLNSFAMSWSELDDDALVAMVSNQPDLRSLMLTDCEKVTNDSLRSLPVHCPLLDSIDLKGVAFVTDVGVVPMLDSPCLKTLSLAEASVTDVTMFAMAEKCGERLRDLDLSWCEDLTDKGLCAMVESCTALQSLALRQCSASRVTMETLSIYCQAMTSLNIAGVNQLTDQLVVTMVTNMPNLTFIDLSWNSGVTSIGVGALLSRCGRLEEAVLSGLKVLTSKPFLAIISDLPRWRTKQEVMIRRKLKSKQTGTPLQTFLKSCNMETAKSLGEDLPFRSTTYSPFLRNLVLEYSDKVNDDHLSQIVAVCRGTLNIRDYYGQPIEPMWLFL